MWSGENPVKRVKLPTLNNKRERFLSHKEAHVLLEEIGKSSKQLRIISLVSLHCGLRAGEIFNLKWSHVDFNNGFLHVADSKSVIRNVPLTTMVTDSLLSLGVGTAENLVFKSKKNDKIESVSVTFSRVIEKLGWNDGIEDRRQRVSFHTLRHTFASWLAIQGTPILTIKELLGHKTLAMTERYSHLIPDVKQEAVKNLERVFEITRHK